METKVFQGQRLVACQIAAYQASATTFYVEVTSPKTGATLRVSAEYMAPKPNLRFFLDTLELTDGMDEFRCRRWFTIQELNAFKAAFDAQAADEAKAMAEFDDTYDWVAENQDLVAIAACQSAYEARGY